MWNPEKTARSIWPEDRVDHFLDHGWHLAPPPSEHKRQDFADITMKVLSYPPNNYDGYSTCYYDIMRSLKYAGIKDTDEIKEADILFYYRQPQMHETLEDRRPVIMYTMIETERMPDWWPAILKEADMVCVPSKAVQKVFKSHGIDAKVLHHGVDHKLFRPKLRFKGNELKFLHLNAFGDNRKGWRQILEAFEKAGFVDREDVSLTFKTVYHHIPDLPNWKNLHVIEKKMEREDVVDLYHNYHCFLFPSWGEGFGLPPVEAMATGMPVITVNATGMAEYVNKHMFIAKHTEPGPKVESYSHFPDQDLGHFHCLVDTDSLAKEMQKVVDNPEAAFVKGMKSAQVIHRKFTYKNYGAGIAKVVNQIMKKSQKYAIFCPSRAKKCGIWKYSEYLAKELKCRMYSKTSSILQCPAKTVFFQHHYGICSSGVLSTLLCYAEDTGTKVVIIPHAWNPVQKQNKIIAKFPMAVHSQRMKEEILRDYPDADITVVPHGCVDTVKSEEFEDVIGAFGIQTQNKNFNQVEVVAQENNLGVKILKSSREGKFYTEEEILDQMSKCKYVMSLAGDDGMIEHSGSVRFLLASGRPVILSGATRHADIPKDCYHLYKEHNPLPENTEDLIINAEKYCKETSWSNVAKLYKML